ncbi:MAG: universal stress protein [Actinomycetota bacterium]|nr:universal stress protein [Actinomycetota bacterium]
MSGRGRHRPGLGRRSAGCVLVAVDGSATAGMAAVNALSVYGERHHYVVLAVVEPRAGARVSTLADADRVSGDVARLLQPFATQRIESGPAGEVVCAVADLLDVVAIAIGAPPGRGRSARSTTRYVLEHADRPVLLTGAVLPG